MAARSIDALLIGTEDDRNVPIGVPGANLRGGGAGRAWWSCISSMTSSMWGTV